MNVWKLVLYLIFLAVFARGNDQESDEDWSSEEEEEEEEDDINAGSKLSRGNDQESEEDGSSEEDEEDDVIAGWKLSDIRLCQRPILHRDPNVFYFPGLFGDRVAERLIHVVNSTQEFQEMHAYDMETDEELVKSKERVMQAAYIEEEEDPIIEQVFSIARQLAVLYSISFDNSLEVFRYRPGGHFSRHFDTHADYSKEHIWSEKWLSTLLLYWKLPATCNCGTAYPHLDMNANPRAGDGLYFFNILTNGTVDPDMEHGGCPVTDGEKWSSFIGFNADDYEDGAKSVKNSPKYYNWVRDPKLSDL